MENHTLDIPIPRIAPVLQVSVSFEGDVLNYFKVAVEQWLTAHWEYLNIAVTARSRNDVSLHKRNIRRFLVRLGLDYKDASFTDWDDDRWRRVLRGTLIGFYSDRYDYKEYGNTLNGRVISYISDYCRSEEGAARIQQLIDEEWLEDLLTEKGLRAVNRVKL